MKFSQKTPENKQKIIHKTAWLLTEGMTGTENPCIGLAEQVGVSYTKRHVHLKQPWKTITPWLHYFSPHHLVDDEPVLSAPFPDLVIASGRKAVAAALWIKKQSPQTYSVFVQNPRVAHQSFDLILAPAHDGLVGDNVISLKINPHHITDDKLNTARNDFKALFDPLPTPRIAVLIGGNSKHHTLTRQKTEILIEQLRQLAETGYGLMVTASRRTGQENATMLKKHLQHANIYYWDGQGRNPYLGLLAWAQAIVVTEDSVSMTSEAVATGKPVYTIGLDCKSARFDQFHHLLQEHGHTKPFDGHLDPLYTPPLPPQEIAIAVQKIQDALLAKGEAQSKK